MPPALDCPLRILCGTPPAFVCPPRIPDALGLRALFNIPIGVEETVIELVDWGADADRREGTRGGFVLSGDELSVERGPDDTVGSVAVGLVAKSIESSGALGAPFWGLSIVDSDILLS